MKKVMMMAMMVAGATSAFAQDALVKEAKGLVAKGEFEQAIKTLTPALTSSETADKAAAWNMLSEINFQKYQKIKNEEVENTVKQTTTPFDTLGMNQSLAAALEAAFKADEFDRQPNEKGKVKIRFRKANQERWTNTRLNLINAGLYFYNNQKQPEALKAWSLYLDCPENEMFTGVDLSKDEYRSEIAYYAGLVAYQMHDYADAEKYARMAAQDPAKAADANEILLFSQKENCKTAADSLAYLNTVKDLHKQNPDEERYFNLLMDYYIQKGDKPAQLAFAEEEIAANPQNKMAWALKGEAQMNNKEWDAAVESYKKVLEIDPTFVQCAFNAGVCLNSKAGDMNDALADKNGNLTNENAEKIKAVLADAKGYLEKAQELDPDHTQVPWVYPLYRIYYALGDKAKMAALEAVDPSLKAE